MEPLDTGKQPQFLTKTIVRSKINLIELLQKLPHFTVSLIYSLCLTFSGSLSQRSNSLLEQYALDRPRLLQHYDDYGAEKLVLSHLTPVKATVSVSLSLDLAGPVHFPQHPCPPKAQLTVPCAILGFGLSRRLDAKKYQVLVVSPRSYFVFTPLLNSTAVGTLEFRTALEPIRRKRSRVDYFQAWAKEVDFASKTVRLEGSLIEPTVTNSNAGSTRSDRNARGEEAKLLEKTDRHKGKVFDVQYDKLVVAVGCYSQTFDTKGVKEHAFFMKNVADARKIRKRVLECFEIALLPVTSDAIRKHLLHFAVVGGGPTGMEFAAELSDLLHDDLLKIYPELKQLVKISVYDIAPRVLPMFDESLAKYAMSVYKREGIDIKTSHHVKELRLGLPDDDVGRTNVWDSQGCYTLRTEEEGEVGVAMCVWSTGNMLNPFVRSAANESRPYPQNSAFETGETASHRPEDLRWTIKTDDKSGAIVVDDRLRVQLEAKHAAGSRRPDATGGLKDVFALGDNAVIENVVLPATAQTANQQALWLAKRLNKGDLESRTFSFKDMGIMTYLGSAKGLVQTPGTSISGISGRAAWLIWRGAYLTLSVSWRNKALIPIYWYVVRCGVRVLAWVVVLMARVQVLELGFWEGYFEVLGWSLCRLEVIGQAVFDV